MESGFLGPMTMQPSLTTPTVPAVQMPVMLVAEVQDSLLVVVHDLTRLDGLLAHTMENLMERCVALMEVNGEGLRHKFVPLD